MKEKLILARNFLYRLFLLGFVVNLFAQVVFMLAVKDQSLTQLSQFVNIPPYYLGELIISSIIYLRLFLFYFVLLPALALHWTIARDKVLK